MELVVSLVIETENGEDLVVLLCVNDLLMSNRTSLLSLHLHVGSGSHETLGSKLGDSRLGKQTLSEHLRLGRNSFYRNGDILGKYKFPRFILYDGMIER